MSVRAPFCSLDTWPAGWTLEQFWKLAHFRETNPDIPVVKPIARSLCRLKYSGYFCLKHKLCLTADIPFYFRSAFQVDLFKGTTKILQACAFIVSLSANFFYDEESQPGGSPTLGCLRLIYTIYSQLPTILAGRLLHQQLNSANPLPSFIIINFY
jgi:hypothetical protein